MSPFRPFNVGAGSSGESPTAALLCTVRSPDVSLSANLRRLEDESIHVLREVAAQFERPVLLFSGGKDC